MIRRTAQKHRRQFLAPPRLNRRWLRTNIAIPLVSKDAKKPEATTLELVRQLQICFNKTVSTLMQDFQLALQTTNEGVNERLAASKFMGYPEGERGDFIFGLIFILFSGEILEIQDQTYEERKICSQNGHFTLCKSSAAPLVGLPKIYYTPVRKPGALMCKGNTDYTKVIKIYEKFKSTYNQRSMTPIAGEALHQNDQQRH